MAIAIIADRFAHSPGVAFATFVSAQVLVFASLVIAVPGIVIPLGFVLAPLGVVVFGAVHDREVWATWWFWVFTALGEIVGGFAMIWFAAKYGSREF